MVGTYGGDSAVSQSLAQCRAVGQGLDGRVALDERLLGSIIRLGEIEVGNDSLARHRGTWRKEVELASRCDVSDMQTSAILMGQLHSQATTLIAGLFAAYCGMELHRGVVAIPLLEGCHIAVDDVGILAMSHQGQVEIVSCLEDAAQRLSLVDKHIASAGAHEELNTGNAMTVQLGETLHIVIGGAVEEGIVDMTFLAAESRLVGQGFECSGLRHRVGHVEIRGDAAKGCGPALTLDVGLGGETGLTEMHMVVDHSWHNKTPRGIDCLVETATRCFFAIINMC